MNPIYELLEQIEEMPSVNLLADAGGLVVGALFLLMLLWLLGWRRQRIYGEHLLHAIQESTPSAVQIIPRRRPGFLAEFALPPAPFRSLAIEYMPPRPLNILAMSRALMGRPGGRLTLCGQLQRSPSAELAWMRHKLPNQAFHQETNAAAWVYRALPVINSQYATRGIHVEPLIRAFIEFQSRFSPDIVQFCIQRDGPRELDLMITTRALNTKIVPHLLASVWMLGRAALRP